MKLLSVKKFYGIEKPSSEVIYTKNFYFSEVLGTSEVSVFGILEVRAPHQDTLAIFNSIIKILQKNLFTGKIEDTFEKALKAINDELDKIKTIAKTREIPPLWFKTFSAFFGVAFGGELYASSAGGTKCYLARDEELEKVSSDNNEYFASINSGSVRNNDKIIVLSSESSALINPDRIALVSREGLESVRFLVESTFLNFDQKQKTFDGLILSVTEYEVEDTPQHFAESSPTFEPAKTAKSKSQQDFLKYLLENSKIFLVNLGVFLKNAYLKFADVAFTKENLSPRNKPSNAIEKIQNPTFVDILKEKLKFKFLTPFGKAFFSVVILLSFFIAYMGISSASNANQKKYEQEQRDYLDECRSKLVDAQARRVQKTQDYEAMARSELKQAQTACQSVDWDELGSEKEALLKDINQERSLLDGVVEPEEPPSILADFATVEDKPFSFDIVLGGDAYAYGEKGIYKFSLTEDVAQLEKLEFDGYDSVGTILASTISEDGKFIFLGNDQNQIFRYDIQDNTISERSIQSGSYPLASFMDTFVRGGTSLPALYITSIANDQVYSFNPTTSGYSTGTARFEGKEFDTLAGVDVDGNIILTWQDGRIEVYLSSDLSASGNLTEGGSQLSTVSKTFKTAATTKFYAADLQNKLIGVFDIGDGSIEYEKSVKFSQVDVPLKDFRVAEDRDRALFLSEDKIYFVNLS
jgi:hypothetical protein